MGLEIKIIKAGDTNLFQSSIFRETFVNTCRVNLDIYNTDGSQGAARGAGMGIGYYSSPAEAYKGLKLIERLKPDSRISENIIQYINNGRKNYKRCSKITLREI